ncbi:MAG TPA: chorismate mutase [Terriglobales bacterium]|nr:chorismate mutase [Terriglobales bacterium]
MDIADWRNKIDELDHKIVGLLNERARAAREIGLLKRDSQSPVYEPEREKQIFENVKRINGGPLPDRDLQQVYERIIDVMRKLQREEAQPAEQARVVVGAKDTEIDAGLNE